MQELASSISPGIFKHTFVIVVNFNKGAQLPRGDCTRLSPCEIARLLLMAVVGSPTAGNVWWHIDCNTYGESDTQPEY